jgi:ABC-type transport system involved in multi-copper enzyme maturation permease subunit
VGGIASLLIPFILSLLAGILYINLDPNIQWDSSAWVELALLNTASITFITLFYLLGLMVSSFSRYSSTSILNCLFLWVLLILVIPNVCPFISAQLYRIPSIRETERKSKAIESLSRQVYWELINESKRKFKNRYGELWSEFESMNLGGIGFLGMVEPKHLKAAQQRAAANPEFKAMMDAYVKEVEKAEKEMRRILKEEGSKLWLDLYAKAAFQTKLAKNLACISPLANFVYVARDLTGTGLRSLDYFERSEWEYRDKRWGPYQKKKFQEAQKNDPTFSYSSYLDISDRPRFVFKEESLRGKLNAVLPYWGILVLFNVVFFAAAFAGFMRYDVR